jgi:hypothetical protein
LPSAKAVSETGSLVAVNSILAVPISGRVDEVSAFALEVITGAVLVFTLTARFAAVSSAGRLK